MTVHSSSRKLVVAGLFGFALLWILLMGMLTWLFGGRASAGTAPVDDGSIKTQITTLDRGKDFEIALSMKITDKADKIVEGLSDRDIEVYEDGQLVHTGNFNPAGQGAIRLALVVDYSSSMNGRKIVEARRAARALIREHGHEAVGMESIATTAGVSRATTYRYFASKEHVVCEAALAWGHEVAARIPQAIAAATEPGEAIDVAIEQVVREAASDLPMVRATMASVLAQGPVADQFRLGVREMFLALMDGASDGAREVPESLSRDPSMTVLGRVFFADLALLGVGDITVEQCIAELRLAARRLLIDTNPGS